MKVLEVREPVVYQKKKVWSKKHGKMVEETKKMYPGLMFIFDDVHSDLEMDQTVIEESKRGVKKRSRAHGTRVFFSYYHGTMSVTPPTAPVRYRSGSIVYDMGMPVVHKPEKNGRGRKDDHGVTFDKFVQRYPHLAATCQVALKESGWTLDKKKNKEIRKEKANAA